MDKSYTSKRPVQPATASTRIDPTYHVYRGHGKTKTPSIALRSAKGRGDDATDTYFEHSNAKRINTDSVFTSALKKQYPGLDLIVVEEYQCNLLAFAGAGHATFHPIHDKGDVPSSLEMTVYLPPARRMNGNKGQLGEAVIFGKFLFQWEGEEFVVYLVDGRDGSESYPQVKNYYILTANVHKVSGLSMNAPLPTLTSITSAPSPAASFFARIDAVISGMDATVAVTSLIAYKRLSAGARSEV